MPKMSNPKIIGITGSMGSGKSTVAKIVAKEYPVLDADAVNRTLLEKGKSGYRALIRKLDVPLDAQKNIDKKALSALMFSDREFKKSVEAILHPLILEEIEEWVEDREDTLIFIEMPLLFEADMEDMFDEIWCVICDEETAIERLESKRNISREEAKARLATQYSPVIKMQQSDVVIDNNADLASLNEQVSYQLQRSRS